MRNKNRVLVRSFMGKYYIATKDNRLYGQAKLITRAEWDATKLKGVVLAKQWKHWCRDSKLTVLDTWNCSSNRNTWLELKGRGYVWRVTLGNMLQIGDSYEEFHSWEYCDIEEVELPVTRDQFRHAVQTLLNRKRSYLVNCDNE